MTRDEIQRIREMEAKATPGPWDGSYMEPDGTVCVVAGAPPARNADGRLTADWLATFDWQDGDGDTEAETNENNAALTATLRNNAVALLDAAEERDRLAAALVDCKDANKNAHDLIAALRAEIAKATKGCQCETCRLRSEVEALKGEKPCAATSS